jgi:CheY-like chemotaxis protein
VKKNCSILLVEDDADDVFFITDALRRSGVDLPVDVAHNGQEAIDYLSGATPPKENGPGPQPRLVFLDLNLPYKTGLQVLKWIRQESPWKIIPVIVLTSSASETDIEQAYLLGANSYIIKPSDATKLREIAQLVKQYWLDWNQSLACPRENGSSRSQEPV